MGRIGAFLIHLGISLVIFAVLAGLVIFVWYPDFFFASDGGWQGIRIIALVDVVLGPLLTLVVFNRSKPTAELRRDLTIIGSLQVICLAAGTYVVYSERPIALVYVDGHYFSMSADDYKEVGVEVPDLSHIPGPTPKRVAVVLPNDPFEQSEVRSAAWKNGQPLRAIASRYQPISKDALAASREALDSAWLERWQQETGDIKAWLENHGGSLDDYAFFPFGARYDYLVLGVDRTDGKILGLLDTPYHTFRNSEAAVAERQEVEEH